MEETAAGFMLLLEASSELSIFATDIQGNAAIATIADAMLNLPEDEDFLVNNPAEGIALISVSALPDNRIQIAVTGADVPPVLDFQAGAASLTVSVGVGEAILPRRGSANAQTPGNDALRLTVMGEQIEDDYLVPNASTATRTDTPILDVPASIQIIPQQVLEDQQVTSLDEALTNISGVTEAGTFGNTTLNFNIRGFDNAPVLVDGFRQFGGFEQNSSEVANLERLEVLRGPASDFVWGDSARRRQQHYTRASALESL